MEGEGKGNGRGGGKEMGGGLGKLPFGVGA